MPLADRPAGAAARRLLYGAAAGALLYPAASQLRVRRAARPQTDEWRRLPVAPGGSTMLGLSFRPLQAETFGLDQRAALARLLGYPYQLIRLPAYWNRIEREPGRFDTAGLDWMIEAAEQAGKRIIVCLGPVKAFGYPEFFVPGHQLPRPLPEGELIGPAGHAVLLRAATTFATALVERYRDRQAIVGWQVEHEAVDPLGLEHSWRLSDAFALAEVSAVRAADPARPVLLSGFLPASAPVALQQWWRTRGQGDSLAFAGRAADIVGIDFYPRHAVLSAAGLTMYLDGSRSSWHRLRLRRVLASAAAGDRRVMIAEGQAEPWEAVTTPPSPAGRVMYSCPPEQMIRNYSLAARWQRHLPGGLWAYLFWGAEYWLLRASQGDPSYLQAFERVLQES
ncbi:MAG TPA: beta-galactosidase [Streptosporangiaceae bacterium]